MLEKEVPLLPFCHSLLSSSGLLLPMNKSMSPSPSMSAHAEL